MFVTSEYKQLNNNNYGKQNDKEGVPKTHHQKSPIIIHKNFSIEYQRVMKNNQKNMINCLDFRADLRILVV